MAEDTIKRILAAKNFYDILGLNKDCGETEIKSAYRKLALQLHPDKCKVPGTEDAFKKVGSAYR